MQNLPFLHLPHSMISQLTQLILSKLTSERLYWTESETKFEKSEKEGNRRRVRMILRIWCGVRGTMICGDWLNDCSDDRWSVSCAMRYIDDVYFRVRGCVIRWIRILNSFFCPLSFFCFLVLIIFLFSGFLLLFFFSCTKEREPCYLTCA